MPRIIIVVLVLSWLAVDARGQPDSTTVDSLAIAKLTAQVSTRLDSLEQRYQISFPARSSWTVRLGLPDFKPASRKALTAAAYLVESQTIALQPYLFWPHQYTDSLRLNLYQQLNPGGLSTVIDHELGHLYADQVSRASFGRPWPVYPDSNARPLEFYGQRILSEGIGEYFGRGPMSGPHADVWWVDRIVHPSLYVVSTLSDVMVYEGGYSLVAPLIARFGMSATIRYIITHPLVITNNRLRRAVIRWRQQAERNIVQAP